MKSKLTENTKRLISMPAWSKRLPGMKSDREFDCDVSLDKSYDAAVEFGFNVKRFRFNIFTRRDDAINFALTVLRVCKYRVRKQR
jgi:hypothetical protein